MKAIMRCLSVAREDVVPLAPQLIGYFNTALDRVCRNPRNPLFNHYLFESTAVLVGSACSANPGLTEQFESLLFPPFQHVLAQVQWVLRLYLNARLSLAVASGFANNCSTLQKKRAIYLCLTPDYANFWCISPHNIRTWRSSRRTCFKF